MCDTVKIRAIKKIFKSLSNKIMNYIWESISQKIIKKKIIQIYGAMCLDKNVEYSHLALAKLSVIFLYISNQKI